MKQLTKDERKLYYKGYASALSDFGIWKDGSQVIGCQDLYCKDILKELAKELENDNEIS